MSNAKKTPKTIHRTNELWGEVQIYKCNERDSKNKTRYHVVLSPEFCQMVGGLEAGHHADINVIGGTLLVSAAKTPTMFSSKSAHKQGGFAHPGTLRFTLTEQECIDRGLKNLVDRCGGTHIRMVNKVKLDKAVGYTGTITN